MSFDSTPQGAEVYLDNVLRGITPLSLDLTSDSKEHSIMFRRKGFEDLTKSIVVDKAESRMNVTLTQMPTREPPKATTPRTTKKRKAPKKRRVTNEPTKKTAPKVKKPTEKPKKAPEDYRNNPYWTQKLEKYAAEVDESLNLEEP